MSLTESIDTTSAAGKMIFRMLAVLAEFERDLVSERTRAALAHKARRGERTGDIPYGWSLAGDGVRLVEIPTEQAIIGEIRARRAAGATLRQIAEELSGRGVPTKKGNARWTHQAVASIVGRVTGRAAAG